MIITVKQIPTEVYELSEDLEMVATHEDAVLVPPCCDGRDCGCHGMYGVECPAWDCPDLTQLEVDNLIERLMPEEPDYE